VDTTDVRGRLSLASEATLVRTGWICTAVVYVSFIISLDDVNFQVGQAGVGADLAERVLGKVGRRFKETWARRLWGDTISHRMNISVLRPSSVS
jgi:hypothetical protein